MLELTGEAVLQAANSLALGTSPVVRALFDPEGGMRSVRALDNVSFTDWFKSHGGSDGSIKRMWDPIGESCFLAPLHACLYSTMTPAATTTGCCSRISDYSYLLVHTFLGHAA